MLKTSLKKLRLYCEQQDFKGWDPYDGLNSRLFQWLPLLKHSALCRLVVIQGFKRCPINLRRLAMVPKQHNAKGIALCLQAYCNMHQALSRNPQLETITGSMSTITEKINYLAQLLLTMRSQGDYHGACWGYNFDWQARRLFLFPKNTPTIVATQFCATALMSAYEVTRHREYLDVALSAAHFVLHDLHRTPYGDGFLFSYSPLHGNDTVFNASMLGSRLLSYCYHYTGNEEFKDAARDSIKACCAAQAADGSWIYGMLPMQSWVDSFHTGYNLDSLAAYEQLTADISFHACLEKGVKYYLDTFFEQDGTPKYYNLKTYPIDIHCPAQLPITLSRLGIYDENKELATKVLTWAITHMQDKKGYFYYQLKTGINSRISYMRWSNAFMLCALSYTLLYE